MKLRSMAWLAVVGMVVALSGAAMAQVKTEPGVARISLIHGDVSTQRGDSGDWSAAALNAPIVEGDRISTGQSSRAELQLDYANLLRLAESAQANINGLSRTQIQVQLGQGLANYSVLRNSEADVEIDTPNMSLHPTRREGSYRIFVLSDEETQVQVRRGEAEIATPQGRTRVKKGDMITVRGTGDSTRYQISDASSKDDFDRWINERDNRIRNAQAWSRTNDYYVGSEDLDAYGRWTTVPDYGPVWVPAVSYGWAPYRSGRWVWQPYWGWTWVSYEPWGWAPYHYGRWFYYGSSWVWWPGPVYHHHHYRPIWAPAYVSFFGFGHGGVGFGFGGGWGSIGWLPIGPCDHYYPWWGGYRTHFNTVNVVNITNVNVYNVHRGALPPLRTGTQFSNLRLVANNERIRGAISTVPANDFGRGRITHQPISREAFRDGKMVTGNLPVVPTRDSLLAGERRSLPVTGRNIDRQQFFGSNRQRVVARESFDREAAEVKTAIQRTGRFTPIEPGSQRTTLNERPAVGEGNRAIPPRQTGDRTDLMRGAKTNEAENRDPMRGAKTNDAGSGKADQSWRRSGRPERQTNPANGAVTNRETTGNREQIGNRQGDGKNSDWRRAPNTGSPARPDRGGSSVDRGDNTNPSRRAPSNDNNQQWRRFDRTNESTPRNNVNSPTEAPASRDRATPAQDRGNDWRRFPSMQERNDSENGQRQNFSGETQRGSDTWRRANPEPQQDSGNWRQAPVERQGDSGNWRQAPAERPNDSWRQSAPRNEGGSYSRPQLDMRQPIVVPRSSGPSGGGHGGGGGASRPSAPSPNRGGGGQHSGGSARPNRGR